MEGLGSDPPEVDGPGLDIVVRGIDGVDLRSVFENIGLGERNSRAEEEIQLFFNRKNVDENHLKQILFNIFLAHIRIMKF